MSTLKSKFVRLIITAASLVLTACGSSGQAAVLPTATASPRVSTAAREDGALVTEWMEKGGSTLHLVDPSTGADIPGSPPISLGGNYAFGFSHASPDQDTLAAIIFPHSSSPMGGVLQLIDLRAWQAVTTTVSIEQWNTRTAFSADGSLLAITAGQYQKNHSRGFVVLVDVAQRAEIGRVELDFLPTQIAFTRDGQALMTFGSPAGDFSNEPLPPSQVALLTIPGLQASWQQILTGVREGFMPNEDASAVPGPGEGRWLRPAAIFAPESDTLYIVHADEDRLTTVDFTNQTASTVDIHPAMSWLDRLMALGAEAAQAKTPDGTTRNAVISPDGRRLYVVGTNVVSTENSNNGQWDTVTTPLGLSVLDTFDGTELARYDTQAVEIGISPDGATLYLRGSYDSFETEIVSAAELKLVARVAGYNLILSHRLNGRPILLSTAYRNGNPFSELSAFDPQSFAMLYQWLPKNESSWLVMP